MDSLKRLVVVLGLAAPAAFAGSVVVPTMNGSVVGMLLPQLIPHRNADLQYSYDASGHMREVSAVGYFKMHYDYDDTGKLMMVTAVGVDDTVLDTFYLHYDDSDRVIAVNDDRHSDDLLDFQYGSNSALSTSSSPINL